jgi:hypothetical protein
MPWLTNYEDNLAICIKEYTAYFAQPTPAEIQELGKTPYITYAENSKRLLDEVKTGYYTTDSVTDLYLLAMAKAHKQLLIMQAFEGIFTGIGAYQMNEAESNAGFDFAKKYDEYAPLLTICDGDPLKIKELEQLPVEYIYLCLDFRSEKAAAERKLMDKK